MQVPLRCESSRSRGYTADFFTPRTFLDSEAGGIEAPSWRARLARRCPGLASLGLQQRCPCRNACAVRKRVAIPACLGITVVVVGVVLLASPLLARHIAAGAQLTLGRLELWEPTDEAVRIRLQGTIFLPKPPLTPTCTTGAAELVLGRDFGSQAGPDGRPLGYRVLAKTRVPSMSLHRTTSIDIESVMEIQDEAALVALFSLLLHSKADLDLKLSGSVSAHMLGYPLGMVPMELKFRAWGLSKLREMAMEGFTLSGSDAQGVRIDSTVAVENPSGLVLRGLGRVDVAISTGGRRLGEMQMEDLTLQVGRTDLAASGHLLPEDPSGAAALFSRWLLGETPTVDFQASSGNASAPSWLRGTLAALAGTARLPKFDGPPFTGGVDVRATSFGLRADGTALVGASLTARVQTPFGFDFGVAGTELHGYLLEAGRPVALLAVPPVRPDWRPDPAQPGYGNASLSFPPVQLQVLDERGLGRVLARSVGANVMLEINGTSRVTTTSVLGEMTVSLPLQVSVTTAGADQFSGMAIASMDVIDGLPGSLQLAVRVDVPNPSPLTADLEPCVQTIVSFKGNDIGKVSVCNVPLRPHGTSSLSHVAVNLSGSDVMPAARMRECVERYVNGLDTVLDVRGAEDGVEGRARELLQPTLDALRAQVLIKGLPKGLITRAVLGVTPEMSRLPSIVTPAKLYIGNPWTGDMNITRVDAQIYTPNVTGQYGPPILSGLLLGQIDNLHLEEDPLVIRGQRQGTEQEMHQLPVRLMIGSCALRHLKSCLLDLKELFIEKHLLVRIVARMHIMVGHGYELEMDYVQEGVPVSLTL